MKFAPEIYMKIKKHFDCSSLPIFCGRICSFFVHTLAPWRYKNLFLEQEQVYVNGRHPTTAKRRVEGTAAWQPVTGNVTPQSSALNERALELCEGLIDIAAALFNVSGKELRQGGRTTLGVARVRQIAMYVAHVTLRLKMVDIGRGFGRDRTTVMHACHLVEDLRDDEDFDRVVAVTERVAMAALCKREAF